MQVILRDQDLTSSSKHSSTPSTSSFPNELRLAYAMALIRYTIALHPLIPYVLPIKAHFLDTFFLF